MADVADGRERRLDPRWIAAERIAGAIGASILSGVALVVVVVLALVGSMPGPLRLLLFPIWFLASAMLGAFVLWWPSVRYRHTAYQVSEVGILIRRGVLWRTVSSVPRSRVQHTDVSRGPIERQLGLATLILYTAGTHHASIGLAGLDHPTALAVRDHLIESAPDDAV
jgi:membrane protein YdbS with pleckstrin-like domain